MNLHSDTLPKVFKGIALFTPGGDLVYCIDPNKQKRWHLHLCMLLRDILELPEPPHFLVSCFTATVDRWVDKAGEIQTFAEAAPTVLKYHPLLNQVFGLEALVWHPLPVQEAVCDPVVLSTYRRQFPQLWESHDLIVQYTLAETTQFQQKPKADLAEPLRSPLPTQGYVFRLFVSGSSAPTERILQNLHGLLEQSLNHPYTLKIIDVSQHPEEAELDQVSATPTLVRVWPHPVRRLVGNLDSADQLLSIIGSPEDWRED